jgi:hypothetical protein
MSGRPPKVPRDGVIICSKCRVELARVCLGGQAIAFGPALVWQPVRFSCEACYSPHSWGPRLPKDELEGEHRRVSDEVRQTLGRNC